MNEPETQMETTATQSSVGTDSTYNGWANYPTWAVNLWLGNDPALAELAVDQARAAVWERGTGNASERLAVADRFKAWVTDELAPDLGASFAADLLGYALALVDWFEIADAWLESAAEQVSS